MQVIMDKMTLPQKAKYLLDWPMAENGNAIDFPFTRSMDHPDIAKEIRDFFLPPATPSSCTISASSAATTAGTTPGTTPGSLNGVTIQVRSSEGDEKDLSAKIGQAKSKL